MKDILQIINVRKSFGVTKVIDGISLSVPEGSVFGFIGVNGAGKTSTMKMALGLLKPDSGEIMVCGESVRFGQTPTNRFVGYLPDVPEFYGYMRPREYLRFCGKIAGLSNEQIKTRSDKLLEMVGLCDVNKKIAAFSRGMKQRLGVAQALINEPRLLICDEPTSALDPVGRKEILDILIRAKEKTTVIFSTHILSDVERICDRVAVLHGGKIALEGGMAELKSRYKALGIKIEFADGEDLRRFCEKTPEKLLGACESQGSSLILSAENVIDAERTVLRIFAENDILPSRFERLEPGIENLFLEVLK